MEILLGIAICCGAIGCGLMLRTIFEKKSLTANWVVEDRGSGSPGV